MISVYLCDDEPIWLQHLGRAVNAYQMKSNWGLEVAYQSTSPLEMLDFVKAHPSEGGIYFLDIDFKSSVNGLELAQQIRKLDPKSSIIFITTHDEMVMETFRLKLSALDYIIKDTNPLNDRVYQVLRHIEQTYCNKEQKDTNTITVRTAGSIQTLRKEDIYFIESIKQTHQVCIHMQNSLYQFKSSLTTLKERLGDDFVLCHKAYLVNVRHIREMRQSTHQIILDNGESCYCSIRKWAYVIAQCKIQSN